MLKNKTQIIECVVIAIFVFLLITFIQQSIFLSQERTLDELDKEIQINRDVNSEIQIEIAKLANDERIIRIAKNKLNMDYPHPKDISYAQKQISSKDKIEYTFVNFITSEVIAEENE
ncbi:MAG: cell division protein FtsL [Candidatus Cloacimonetes bacterium]|nr:cell division protein FtsL [Candidatus Cloacimonadota bacterium]